jgi:hypothetical protein
MHWVSDSIGSLNERDYDFCIAIASLSHAQPSAIDSTAGTKSSFSYLRLSSKESCCQSFVPRMSQKTSPKS